MDFTIGTCSDCPMTLATACGFALVSLASLAASRWLARSGRRLAVFSGGLLLGVAFLDGAFGVLAVAKYGIFWSERVERVFPADLTFLVAWALASALLLVSIRRRR